MQFDLSQTHINLMRAFAGESQARNRYTFAAGQCSAKGLYLLERLFLFTAGQEKEHAELFYGYLSSLNGRNITIDAAYPVGNYEEIGLLLRDAEHNETEDFASAYPAFAEVAKSEGFQAVGILFDNIAKIEKTHADRFARYAQLMEEGRLFREGSETAWMCLNCGHVHYAAEAPGICPVCRHEQGYFVRADGALLG